MDFTKRARSRSLRVAVARARGTLGRGRKVERRG